VRCLLIAPSGLDLSLLAAVLADQAVEVESTSDIGAGAALAQVDLDQFDFGLAVVPAGHGEGMVGLSAIYVEIGVAVARSLPLLAVVEPPGPLSPALAGLTTVTSSIGNTEALRLHLGLFLRSVLTASADRRIPLQTTTAANLVPAAYRVRLEELRDSPPHERVVAFEQLVSDLLRDAGAQIEERPPSSPDVGVDIAAFLPGEEQRLGSLLVEVKSEMLTGSDLGREQQKLSAQVLQTRSGLGLLVYNEATIGARKIPSAPLVFRLGIDELLTELEVRSLSDLLIRARNRAVHGM
jgi:hypothetical protein